MARPKKTEEAQATPELPVPAPTCASCRWGGRLRGSEMVECEVDLPPFVAQWPDYKKRLTHKSYRCALWQAKD